MTSAAFCLLTAMTVSMAPQALAQTRTWTGAQSNNGNSSAIGNWAEGAPTSDTAYHVIYEPANLSTPFRTTTAYNTTGFGFLSLSLAGNETYSGFTLTGTTATTLSGNVTAASGTHNFNVLNTVTADTTWNIALGAQITLASTGGGNNVSHSADKTLTKSGIGTLVFAGSQTNFAGTIRLDQGTIVGQNQGGMGTAALVLNAGSLVLQRNELSNYGNNATVTGDVTVTSSRATTAGDGVNHALGALAIGAHTLTMNSGNNGLLTGGTAGISFGATTLTGDATFHIVNNLEGVTSRLRLGAISGSGLGFTKTGSGVLQLDAANTYSGATVVNGGSLILGAAGSIGNSSVLNVASGATLHVSAVSGGFVVGSTQTLQGNGTIVGNTTVNGALQPGNSPGLLTFDNDLTLGSSAVTTMEINGTGVRGTAFDAINVGGLLTYGGTLSLSLGTTFGFGSYSFDLFDFGSTSGSFGAVDLGGLYSGSLVNNGSGVWGLTSGNDTWTFTESSGLLALDVVPEPSTYALLVLAAAGLGARVIRRRRR